MASIWLGLLRHGAAVAVAAAFTACGASASLSGSSKAPAKGEDKEKSEDVSERSSSSDAGEHGEDEDDLRAVPPEVVSGAYLVCDTVEEAAETDNLEGYGYYGCTAFGSDDARLDLSAYAVDFELAAKSDAALTAERLEPGAFGRDEHAMWRLPESELAAGVSAWMDVKTTSGVVVTIKKRGNVTIIDETPGSGETND